MFCPFDSTWERQCFTHSLLCPSQSLPVNGSALGLPLDCTAPQTVAPSQFHEYTPSQQLAWTCKIYRKTTRQQMNLPASTMSLWYTNILIMATCMLINVMWTIHSIFNRLYVFFFICILNLFTYGTVYCNYMPKVITFECPGTSALYRKNR